jgi:hypothetical protein
MKHVQEQQQDEWEEDDEAQVSPLSIYLQVLYPGTNMFLKQSTFKLCPQHLSSDCLFAQVVSILELLLLAILYFRALAIALCDI